MPLSASLETFKRGGDSWTESELANFSLHFVRDKQKREVDFLVTRDNHPWFLVEVKSSSKTGLSDSLEYFQRQTAAAHAFQVAATGLIAVVLRRPLAAVTVRIIS